MDGLDKKIVELIENTYNCLFEGKVESSVKLDLYKVIFYLHNDDYTPSITLATQCNSEEEFLKYIEKELKERKLHTFGFAKINLYPYEYKDERC